MSEPEFKKRWLVVLKINVGGLHPSEIADYMHGVKQTLPEEAFNEFFETKTMCLYIPTREGETQIELHEIILNGFGYDKFETTIKDNNLTIRNMLDNIKELLDGSDNKQE